MCRRILAVGRWPPLIPRASKISLICSPGAQHPVIVTEDAGKTLKSVNLLVEIAELLGCPVVETRSTGVINIPRTHALHSGYDAKEGVQGALT